MKLIDKKIVALQETRSFDQRIQDLQEYKRTYGHIEVKRSENDSLAQFCCQIRHPRKMMAKCECYNKMAITEERIAKLDTLGFKWCY